VHDVRGGADVIEVGLRYSDPLMDGPVIADVFDMVSAIAGTGTGTAAVVMTYWNPVDRWASPAPRTP
jgi:tryptophan synthase alpha chain